MARKTSKRISSEEMAKIAHETGAPIELDGGYAYMTVGAIEYVCTLDHEAAK